MKRLLKAQCVAASSLCTSRPTKSRFVFLLNAGNPVCFSALVWKLTRLEGNLHRSWSVTSCRYFTHIDSEICIPSAYPVAHALRFIWPVKWNCISTFFTIWHGSSSCLWNLTRTWKVVGSLTQKCLYSTFCFKSPSAWGNYVRSPQKKPKCGALIDAHEDPSSNLHDWTQCLRRYDSLQQLGSVGALLWSRRSNNETSKQEAIVSH